ncbi:MAG TPA: pitrilysin family protein [Pyrinomonadaceae bacterium]|jgi:predicted Zn-dependent peptidase|nr:pitrilysin family protein [Pyrinomonadaceae bacterium]
MKRISFCVLTIFLCAAAVAAQKVPVQEVMLDNGMRVLMVQRKGDPNIAVGWVARVGSVNERPGITGLSHLFEHMMFKGTHVIGTKDYAAHKKVLDEMDAVRAELRREEISLIQKARLGEIGDAKDPKNRSAKHQQLLARFNELTKQEKDLMVKDEYDRVYTTAGGSGMNAGTSNDFTVYFINVPANKIELWFWMESDRLANHVFREFYSERDVVHEERRLRTDSTPTGKFDEQYESMFWQSSPYGWPVVGWPSDLEGITREEAEDYFAVNYAPNNLTACLVGDFDPARATELARKYFGRLQRGPRAPEPVRTQEMTQLAEKRMVAYAETTPQVRVRFHTVADGHPDDFALNILADILNGRTGRLYKSLVLGQAVANSAGAGQDGRKYEGLFEISGVAKPGHTPEEVEQALYREIEKLQKEPVGAEELQKVKNQNTAGDFRRLQSNFFLMVQLLLRDANRGWETINTDPARVQAVTAEDIRRVANKYFKPENRTVGVYFTKKAEGAAAGAAEDPLLAGLDDQEKAQVQRVRAMLAQAKPEQVRAILGQIEQQGASAPADKQDMLKVIKKLLEDRLKQLEGAKQ